MSEGTNTAAIEPTPLESKNEGLPVDSATPQPKASPAADLRDIQTLLVSGIYPGNMAPAVVKGYQLLERMCTQIEASVEVK